MSDSKPKLDDDADEPAAAAVDDPNRTLTQISKSEIKADDPNKTKTQITGTSELKSEASLSLATNTNIEVDRIGPPHREKLKMSTPGISVSARPKIRVSYSAKAEASTFTLFRIIVFFIVFLMVASLLYKQNKISAAGGKSTLQSMGLLSQYGRQLGLLPPLADFNEGVSLNTVRIDASLKNLKVTVNGQELGVNKFFELFVPMHTDLYIQIAAEGIRPHSLEINFDKPIPYILKPKYFLVNTGILNLTTDVESNIILYLDGEVLVEKSAPMLNWPLPEGRYHAVIQNDIENLKKTIDFSITAGRETILDENLKPKD